MTHEAEYYENMVKMLELIWGEGYMAPGGPGNVAKLLAGSDPEGKLILDIGCGIGGPALEMVRGHGAQVVGIDLEAPLIERANSDARAAGLHEHCMFKHVSPGPLPFADMSFDIVVSSGAFTQTPDKAALFSEAFRVLKPGGYLSCYEWMGTGQAHSDELQYWIELEELTYEFETLERYGERLRQAGFMNVTTTDASDWYRAEAHREYELIKGDLYASMVEHLGQADADHFVKDWGAMVVVCDSGEMRQGYCRGRRWD